METYNNLESQAEKNNAYRKVLTTTENMQLVLMSLKPKEEIGLETHKKIDQFIRIEVGTCKAILNGKSKTLKAGSSIIIPKGTTHNIINVGTSPAKLYTIYSPPNHPDGLVQKLKPDFD